MSRAGAAAERNIKAATWKRTRKSWPPSGRDNASPAEAGKNPCGRTTPGVS